MTPHEATTLPTRVELFRLFTETGRLQVMALCGQEELSVSELCTLLKDSQPQVSRKVGALRDAGLLDSRKDGSRLFVRTMPSTDGVVLEAIAEGRRLCLEDGSLSRVPAIIAAREEHGRSYFEDAPPAGIAEPSAPEHLAHLAALAPLLPGQRLALDIGTGDGLVLDVLAPLYQRVIAIDRSRAQLARVAGRIASRGFHHVSLHEGSYDDATLQQRVDSLGGADLVFVGRSLHHASRPAQAMVSFARLLKRGGHVVVLDYLSHEIDALRSEHADVWAGFDVATVPSLFTDAGLAPVGQVPIPAAYHPTGPDAQTHWHAWVAKKPSL